MTDKFLSSLTTAVALLSSGVAAHGYIQGIVAEDVFYQGYRPSFQYLSEQPIVAGWSDPQNLDNGFVSDYSSPNIICNLDATPGQTYATVEAGGTVELQWTPWPVGHLGPVITYLANCNGACTSVDKTELLFNKINEAGLLEEGIPGKWASGELAANNNSWTVQIPSEIAPGNYVLRNEIIALQQAMTVGGAQNYPMCVNLKVTGSGSNSLQSGTLGTDLYQANDPGLVINIYQDLANYTIPGPPLLAGSPNGPSPQPTNLQSATSTAPVYSGTAPAAASSGIASSSFSFSNLTATSSSSASASTSSLYVSSIMSSTSFVSTSVSSSSVTSSLSVITVTVTDTIAASTSSSSSVSSSTSSYSTTTTTTSVPLIFVTVPFSSSSASSTYSSSSTSPIPSTTSSVSSSSIFSIPSVTPSSTTTSQRSSPTTFATFTISNTTSSATASTSFNSDLTSTSTDLVTLTVTVPGVFAAPSTLASLSAFPTTTVSAGGFYPFNNGTSWNGTAWSSGAAWPSGTAWSSGSWSTATWTASAPTGTGLTWSSVSMETATPVDNGYKFKRSMRIVRRDSQ